MYIDATRTGYILPLAGVEHVVGRESKADTGESHAYAAPDSLWVQELLYSSYALPSGENGEYREHYVMDLHTNAPQGESDVLQFSVVREPRRIKALKRIVEKDISTEFQSGPRAVFFKDSVGIGYHPISIASEKEASKDLVIKVVPFQISLGALIPVRFTNLLAGGGTLSSTHVTASAYRAPSVEWAIGEAAGEAAAYCAGFKINTHELAKSSEHIRELQNWLVIKRSVPIYWYDDVTPQDQDFKEAQLKPFDDPD